MKRKALIATAAAAAVLVTWLLYRAGVPGYTRIDLAEGDGERTFFTAVIADGETVTLSWRNSQFGLRVKEVFTGKSGFLVQDRVTFFREGGPPPPRVSPRDVEDLYHTGGPFDATGLSRPFRRIVYRVGEIGDPKLSVGGRTVALKKEAGFGGRVVLTASRPAFHDILRKRAE